jgi:hypothetical protein
LRVKLDLEHWWVRESAGSADQSESIQISWIDAIDATTGVEGRGRLLCENFHLGARSAWGIGKPSTQVSPILAVRVSGCLDEVEDAIHLWVQTVFHLLAASSILVWLEAFLDSKYQESP